MLAGDFDAVVGKPDDTDCEINSKRKFPQACGKLGYGTRNQKGQRLQQFCTQENLSIGNTFFDKPDDKLWIHRSVKAGGVEYLRQIDFIIIGTKDKCRFQNVDAEDDLDTGNYNRTVAATLRINSKQSKINKTPKNIETLANRK